MSDSRLPRRRFARFCAGSMLVPAIGYRSSGAAQQAAPTLSWNVRDFGAVGDGASLDTRALQAAIDRCSSSGGGTVHFPAGRYLSGGLDLRSRVTCYLAAGAVLLGSRKLEDFPVRIPALRSYTDNYTERSLLYAENAEGVSICGRGTIDGQGASFKGAYKLRPYLIRMIACRNVSLRDITLRDSPMWVQHYLACDGVLIDGITVASKCNANNDGIDIDGCTRVRISNCDIRSGDDALVLKSTLDRPCRNVVVTNCTLNSDCNAFKLGTESNGGFEDVLMSNCSIYDTRLAGIALELVDGGSMERVGISNVTIHNTRGAIFVRLGDRGRPFREGTTKPGVGRLREVRLSNILATGADVIGCSITGLPGHPVEQISLNHVRVILAGGGTASDAGKEVEENREKYPEYRMFGTLPACGFYCRHVRGLRFEDVDVVASAEDRRPALFCDDVEELELSGWRGRGAGDNLVRFRNVRNAFIHGCRIPTAARPFLRVEGPDTADVVLAANGAPVGTRTVELGSDVNPGAVRHENGR